VRGVAYLDMDAMADRDQIRRAADWGPAATTQTARAWVRARVFSRKAGEKLSFWSRVGKHQENWWQTTSARFYARAGDARASRVLGRWIASRCGFKDQLALWHALLEEASAAGCLRAPYAGDVLEGMSYWEARRYPKRGRKHRADADPLLGRCAAVQARCPALGICDERVKMLDGLFTHATVGADDVRRFAFLDREGHRHSLVAPDYVPKLLAAKHNASYARVYAESAMPEALYIQYFGLDLFEPARFIAKPEPAPRKRAARGFLAWLRHLVHCRPLTTDRPKGC